MQAEEKEERDAALKKINQLLMIKTEGQAKNRYTFPLFTVKRGISRLSLVRKGCQLGLGFVDLPCCHRILCLDRGFDHAPIHLLELDPEPSILPGRTPSNSIWEEAGAARRARMLYSYPYFF